VLVDLPLFTSHPLFQTLLILVVAVIGAVIVDILFRRVLGRLSSRTRTDLDDQIIKMARLPLSLTVLLIGLQAVVGTYPLAAGTAYFFHRIIYTLLLLVVGLMVLRLSGVVFAHLIGRARDEGKTEAATQMLPFLENITQTFILVVIGLFFLSIWGVDVTPLLASAGIAGVAVAFAARDTLANLFGGISVFMDRPYKVGDFIIVDDRQRGEVIEIGLRSTRIKTRDDVYITIPNSIMATTKVVNETGFEAPLRLRIKVGIAYGTDLDRAEEILLRVAGENREVLKKPEPRVRFRSFGETALEYELLCWVSEPVDKGRVTHELNRAVYQEFAKAGVVIPFPQLDVHLDR
jgi:small-conductance mechanosensitive channel